MVFRFTVRFAALLSLCLLLSTVPVSGASPPAAQPPAQPVVSAGIVVTAAASPESLETTTADVTVISKEAIQERAARDVADVLREVPGLQVSRSGSPGKTTSLFTRGGNSTHTLVLWNGIEINNPYFSGYDWGRFSTAGVERIEVVRGPLSALYGSDAVAGVVNVLTGSARNSIDADLQAGGRGLVNSNAGGTIVSRRFSLSGSFEDRKDDGFAANDDFSQQAGTAQVTWTASLRSSLSLLARRTSYELGIPFNNNADATRLVPSLKRRQQGTETQIAIPISQTFGRVAYSLTLSESRRSDDFTDPEDPFGTTSSTTESSTRRAYGLAHTATWLGKVSFGGEIERNEMDDFSNYGPNLTRSRRNSSSLFLEDRLSRTLTPTIGLEVTAGFRRDDFRTFGSETSPRLAIALLSGRQKFRASYGAGFRAPSTGELFFPFFGNPELEAERTRTAEAGYDVTFGRSGSFSATLFRSNFRDLIVYDNPTFQFQNVGRARSSGLEINLQHDIQAGVKGGLSYMRLSTRQGNGDPLLRRPRNSGSAFLSYQTGRFSALATGSWIGRRADVMAVVPFANVESESYSVTDFTARYSVGTLTPYLKLENAFDQRYEEVTGYPAARRRVSVGVHYSPR